MRAALYARFSSAELQTDKSITDQLTECRRHAEKLGATVVTEFSDAGISAVAMLTRPGVMDLMAAARQTPRPFDLVIADELSRLTRDGGHAWDLFNDLAALGIAIDTPNEGRVDELRIGLGGTMNQLDRKRIAQRVRRGLAGVVGEGRWASRPPYGYRLARVYDEASGERIKGVLEVFEPEAAIVRRIVAEVAAGSTAHAVVLRLNAEGVPGPRGRAWEVSAVGHGAGGRIRGICRNPVYVGEIVWNRTTQPKDRRSGRAVVRDNPQGEWRRRAAPELAIVERATWDSAQAAMAVRADAAIASGCLARANTPRDLLSGLVRCGVCGGGMHRSGPGRRYRCLTRGRRGPSQCANATGADPVEVERQALEALTRDLLHPEVVEAFVREYQAARREAEGQARAARERIERQARDARAQADRLLGEVAAGHLAGRMVAAKLAELEAQADRAAAELAALDRSAEVVTLHPHAAQRYRRMVEELRDSLAAAPPHGAPASPELEAARRALRQVIRGVIITPDTLAAPGQRATPSNRPAHWTLTLDGDLTALLRDAQADPGARRATL